MEHGYLPEAIWKNTRGYIEKIAFQVNGCFQYGFYDCASVLFRRLVETLLIECYEHKKTQFCIANLDGNYFMLSGIIADAVDKSGLSLGRETKSVFRELKAIGDHAAHHRLQEAAIVFNDSLSITFPDPNPSVGESRYIIIDGSKFGQLLVVAHAE